MSGEHNSSKYFFMHCAKPKFSTSSADRWKKGNAARKQFTLILSCLKCACSITMIILRAASNIYRIPLLQIQLRQNILHNGATLKLCWCENKSRHSIQLPPKRNHTKALIMCRCPFQQNKLNIDSF